MTQTTQTITTRAAARQRGYSVTELPDGRHRARLDLPPGPDGKRRQRTRILATAEAAHTWAQTTNAQVEAGEHIDHAPDTFTSMSTSWLDSRDVRPVTRRGYVVALQPALAAFGDRKVQDITPAMVRALMQSQRGRGKATNTQMMYVVRGTFALAVDDGLIRTNPAAKVKITGKPAQVRDDLSPADADLIAAHVVGDRLELCWRLTLAGLRRSEVMGLRWEDIDTAAGTVTVARGRVDMGKDSTATTDPKSTRSRRTLPMSEALAAAATRTRTARKAEVLAWQAARWDDRAFVAVDECLRPLRPEAYSDAWGRLQVAAACTHPVTLYGARHGSATRMLDRGVPVHVVAAWHGHDPAVTLRTYAHTDLDTLASAGAALEACQ